MYLCTQANDTQMPQGQENGCGGLQSPYDGTDIKRTNPSQTGGYHHGSTKCGNEFILQKIARFNRVTVKIIKT